MRPWTSFPCNSDGLQRLGLCFQLGKGRPKDTALGRIGTCSFVGLRWAQVCQCLPPNWVPLRLLVSSVLICFVLFVAWCCLGLLASRSSRVCLQTWSTVPPERSYRWATLWAPHWLCRLFRQLWGPGRLRTKIRTRCLGWRCKCQKPLGCAKISKCTTKTRLGVFGHVWNPGNDSNLNNHKHREQLVSAPTRLTRVQEDPRTRSPQRIATPIFYSKTRHLQCTSMCKYCGTVVASQVATICCKFSGRIASWPLCVASWGSSSNWKFRISSQCLRMRLPDSSFTTILPGLMSMKVKHGQTTSYHSYCYSATLPYLAWHPASPQPGRVLGRIVDPQHFSFAAV